MYHGTDAVDSVGKSMNVWVHPDVLGGDMAEIPGRAERHLPFECSDFSWSQLLGALVMINARLFRALVNAGPNNAQIIGADNGRLRADIDRIISQLFS